MAQLCIKSLKAKFTAQYFLKLAVETPKSYLMDKELSSAGTIVESVTELAPLEVANNAGIWINYQHAVS